MRLDRVATTAGKMKVCTFCMYSRQTVNWVVLAQIVVNDGRLGYVKSREVQINLCVVVMDM